MGFRVCKRTRKVEADLVELYRRIPVANVSDNMWRMNSGGSSLRAMHDGSVMVGAALTVRCRPGDNLMIHKALDLAGEGDIIVVDAGGDLTNSLFGEIMMAMAVQRRLGGIVLNGAVRDWGAIRESSFPVYACGVTHRGPYKDGPGEINVPICLGGMVIEPGDLMLGDLDGVVCVPSAVARSVYERAHAKHMAEEKILQTIRDGEGTDRSWVDETLKSRGCEFVD